MPRVNEGVSEEGACDSVTPCSLKDLLHQKHGSKPIVAVIGENHAYLLATLFATWKLGGVFTPLDYHVSRDILERT
jgi:acyl-CoA synthetase (AMP-forming)/AMP-acid ligase II